MTGVSAAALGLFVGLSRGTLSMIESGERPAPSTKTLSALAGLPSVTLEWLIDGTGTPPDEATLRAAVQGKDSDATDPPVVTDGADGG